MAKVFQILVPDNTQAEWLAISSQFEMTSWTECPSLTKCHILCDS